jgi:hypothetical protein
MDDDTDLNLGASGAGLSDYFATGELSAPTHWPSLPAADLAEEWDRLRDWVESFADRFNLGIDRIPPCWYLHNALVEALSALRDHERASYAPNGSPTGPLDWLRAFREIEARLIEWSARTGCDARQHRPEQPREWRTDPDQWAAFVQSATDARDRAALRAGIAI